jgi:hypothetical protein
MKWSELPEDSKVELLQELVYLNEESSEHTYRYLTRAEIEAWIDSCYPAGTIFTLMQEDGSVLLQCPDGHIGMSGDDEIDPALFKVLP